MKSKPRFTFDEVRAALEASANNGTGISGAARTLGICRAAVHAYIKRWPNLTEGIETTPSGWARGRSRSPGLDPTEVTKAGGADAVASELGVSRRTVFRRMAKAKAKASTRDA